MLLRCPKCKSEFVQFLREPQTTNECRKCGAKIPLDALARVERYQLPGRLRIVKWCAAPADAPEDELRRIFSIVDEPQCDDMVVWFYSSLEDIGRKPFDVALLERSGKDTWPTIRRPT